MNIPMTKTTTSYFLCLVVCQLLSLMAMEVHRSRHNLPVRLLLYYLLIRNGCENAVQCFKSEMDPVSNLYEKN
jgi:hypothetical protein